MSQRFLPDEPIPDHLADTGPMQALRHPETNQSVPGWQRMLGLFSLIGATALTIGAMLIMLTPNDSQNPLPDEPALVEQTEDDATPADATSTPPTEPENNRVGEPIAEISVLPTLDASQAGAILNQPLALASNRGGDPFESVRDIYNPFTIIPDRTRSGVEDYVIESGDTIFALAERFGLEPETIVWGNDNSIVEGLRPGRAINILPVDGVYHQALNGDTVNTVATKYGVDPYAIIDSEFNDLFGVEPDDPLPEGTWVVVPGGEREQISWNPVVQRVEAGSGAAGSQGAISFAPGEAGSCGLVTNPGGSFWAKPLAGYQWIRGFSGVHSGVDLSAPVGAPVYAANGGSVIFAGWNSYGYGYTIVLAHGPFTTLYGHLSAINVGCAQYVSPGQPIGGVGSSGNSSGPHLHFEIRYLDTPQDPTYTMPF